MYVFVFDFNYKLIRIRNEIWFLVNWVGLFLFICFYIFVFLCFYGNVNVVFDSDDIFILILNSENMGIFFNNN